MAEDLPHELDAYLDLNSEEIARLVLCLSIEELLQKRLATFRRPGIREWRDDGAFRSEGVTIRPTTVP